MTLSKWSFSPAGSVWNYTSDLMDTLTAVVKPVDVREVGEYRIDIRYKNSVFECSKLFGAAPQAIEFVNKLMVGVTRKLTEDSLRAKLVEAEKTLVALPNRS